jgi:XTP/dITP diphosphohydrolase
MPSFEFRISNFVLMRLLIATTNPGKLAEISLFLQDLPVTLVSLKDIPSIDPPEETGTTFEENAILKARYYSEKSGLPTIADDGGFEIDALGGEPGVKSHRWVYGDRENTDQELIDYTFSRMKDIPTGKRQADLRVVLALVDSGKVIRTTTAMIAGVVPDKPADILTPGFPYRSILYLPEIGKYYNHDLLTPEETVLYNHRRKAIEELKPFIRILSEIDVVYS